MLVRNHSDTKIMQYETITVTNPHEYVYHVQFNRPNKRNAMNPTFFRYF
jgi:enoyl-CoA hydratase/carnithine racemase